MCAMLMIAFSAGCVKEERQLRAEGNFNISFNPIAGEIVELSVKTNLENATLMLPTNILPVINSVISTDTVLDFSGPDLTLHVLIPPNTTMFDITLTNGIHRETFSFQAGCGQSPVVSGKDIFDRVEHITSNYPLRITLTPMDTYFKLSYLKPTLEQYGLEVHAIPVVDSTGINSALNVVAYHWGADKSTWLIMGAHADTATTIEGAYDNTAGVATVLELAESLSKFKFDKTIVFGFWGGEEEGLWGSRLFVQDLPEDVKVDAYLNFDMVGINWPGPAGDPVPLHEYMRHSDEGITEKMVNFGRFITYEICNYPEIEEAFNITEDTLGRSDHVSFANAGVPSFMFIGELDNYPYYHTPDDTFENMIEYMGGEEILIKGFAVPAWIGFYITIFTNASMFLVSE